MIPAIGYTMCGANLNWLQSTVSLDAHPTAVEINLEGLYDSPESVRDLEFERVSLHAVSLALRPANSPPEFTLTRLTDLARTSGAQAVIARLDSTPVPTADGCANSVPAPRAWKTETADLCKQVESVQSQLGEIPFYLESDVAAEWFTRNSHDKRVFRKVLAGTGCGWFLDLTALYVEAMNSAKDACDLIEEMLPAVDRMQLRLSGVFFDEAVERWVSSDSHPIPEAIYELYAFVLEVALEKVDAVFVKQDVELTDATECCHEFRTVREIAEGVSAIA